MNDINWGTSFWVLHRWDGVLLLGCEAEHNGVQERSGQESLYWFDSDVGGKTFEEEMLGCDRKIMSSEAFSLRSLTHYVYSLWKWGESHSVVSDSLWPHGIYSPWNSPGQNTGVGSLSLLQGIFPTQGSNPGLLHCRWILYQLSHEGSPTYFQTQSTYLKWPLSSSEFSLFMGHILCVGRWGARGWKVGGN